MKKAIVYTKKLESAGLTREQAEAHLEILEEIFDVEIATKNDLMAVRSDLQKDIDGVNNELKLFRLDMQHMKNEIIIKLGIGMVAALGAIATFFKFLI